MKGRPSGDTPVRHTMPNAALLAIASATTGSAPVASMMMSGGAASATVATSLWW